MEISWYSQSTPSQHITAAIHSHLSKLEIKWVYLTWGLRYASLGVRFRGRCQTAHFMQHSFEEKKSQRGDALTAYTRSVCRWLCFARPVTLCPCVTLICVAIQQFFFFFFFLSSYNDTKITTTTSPTKRLYPNQRPPSSLPVSGPSGLSSSVSCLSLV